jgi:glycerol uptake facilitator protein
MKAAQLHRDQEPGLHLDAPAAQAAGPDEPESWIGRYLGEAIGTFLLVFFGCGIVFVAVLFGGVGDLFSAGMAWGFAVAIAIYVTASMSGTHINPAVTLALAATGRFPWRKVPPYALAQIGGAFLGAATLMAMFGGAFHRFAIAEKITIGAKGSEKLAMMLVPYSPHPGIVGIGQEAYAQVPIWRGAFTEIVATALLMVIILAMLERRSVNAPSSWFFPVSLAFGVAMLVFVTAPLTMTSLNPARDLGPRLLTLVLGFGRVAFPGPRGGGSLLVTVGGPIAGACIGAFFFDLVMRPHYPAVVLPEAEGAA